LSQTKLLVENAKRVGLLLQIVGFFDEEGETKWFDGYIPKDYNQIVFSMRIWLKG